MSDDRPVFDQLNLVVADMAATVAFYRLLGVQIDDTLPAWNLHHRTVTQPEGMGLELDSAESARRWNAGWPRAAGTLVGFRVTSRGAVDDLHRKLTDAGYRSQQPPYDAMWGARYAIVEDPDGNAVGLMSAVDPNMRAAPPPPV